MALAAPAWVAREVSLAALHAEVYLSAEAMEACWLAAPLVLAHLVLGATELTAATEATAVRAGPLVGLAFLVRHHAPSQVQLESVPEAHMVQEAVGATTVLKTLASAVEALASKVETLASAVQVVSAVQVASRVVLD